MFKITLKSLGRTFNSQGKTLEEALDKIKISGAKVSCVLTIDNGETIKEKIIPGGLALRLFGKVSPTMKEIALKNIKQRFDL